MPFKNLIKDCLFFLHLDVTKNLKYDRLTKKVMKKIITPNSNCIDIGCHKGEILEDIIALSTKGQHFAFEPIPSLYDELLSKFPNVNVFPFALANEDKIATFNYVKNAPEYSGIKKRKYAIENPEIEEIKVQIKKLDDIIYPQVKIDFIKLDVEGAELDVLKGAKELLINNKPHIVFEFGLGASDFYDTKPHDIYSLLVNDIGLKISTLDFWLKKRHSLSETDFVNCFNQSLDYYFIAHP